MSCFLYIISEPNKNNFLILSTMIKKILTPAFIAIFFWGIGLLIINEYYYEYFRPYQYISLLIILSITIWSLIQKRKNDKINGTQEFKDSIYRMMFMAVIMIIVFFATKQNHI